MRRGARPVIDRPVPAAPRPPPRTPGLRPLGAADPRQSTLDALPDVLAVVDGRGDVVAVNAAWQAFGRANGGGDVGVGAGYLDVCRRAADHEPVAADALAGLTDVLAGRRDEHAVVYPCHAPDRERWMELRVSPLVQGDRLQALVAHRDVTAVQRALQRAHRRTALVDAVDAAIVATDLAGTITEWSGGAEELLGWLAHEVLGRPVFDVDLGVRDPQVAVTGMRSVLECGSWEGEVEVVDRAGRRLPAFVRSRLLTDATGAPAGVVGIAVDLSDRVAIERRLAAAHDVLAKVTATIPDGLCVLDDAGRVTMANPAAEQLLGWSAQELHGASLEERVRPGRPAHGPTPRAGDDELVRADGGRLPVSWRSATFVSEAGDPGQVVVFTDISDRKARERELLAELETLGWLRRIEDALEQGRFALFAQPIVDVLTGEAVQHELLLRMRNVDGSLVGPGAFLPVAEEHGIIRAIDDWVLRAAMPFAAAGHHVELNLSAASLSDPGLVGRVRQLLGEHDVAPELLVFEITETAVIRDEEVAAAFVAQVRRLGCGVALDDFGTGYGGFHYLKRMPVDLLKIDRDFVRDLDGEGAATSRHVIRAIVSLARGLGMRTVAEGVETEPQRREVEALGVDLLQGFLVQGPRPAAELLPIGAVHQLGRAG